VGGTLVQYFPEATQIYLLTATKGERGRFGDNTNRPPAEEIGKEVDSELRQENFTVSEGL
jgi:LmbE family N-acetylglucosaminyl deacetylase